MKTMKSLKIWLSFLAAFAVVLSLVACGTEETEDKGPDCPAGGELKKECLEGTWVMSAELATSYPEIGFLPAGEEHVLMFDVDTSMSDPAQPEPFAYYVVANGDTVSRNFGDYWIPQEKGGDTLRIQWVVGEKAAGPWDYHVEADSLQVKFIGANPSAFRNSGTQFVTYLEIFQKEGTPFGKAADGEETPAQETTSSSSTVEAVSSAAE